MSQQIDREQRIRELAYRIWESQGCPPGHDMQHWLDAERQIDVDESTTRVKAGTRSAKSRGALSDHISRKAPPAAAKHTPKMPSRKGLPSSAGKKITEGPPTRKSPN